MRPTSGHMQRRRIPILFCAVLLAPSLALGQIVEYAHLDGLGNIRVVTDQNGAIIERHDYLPFGEEWNPQPGNQPLRFTGKERDTETGFDYFGARYYQAKWGRFTTTDPVYNWRESLVDPQRWNRYAYARNNPFRWVDPDGKDPVTTGVVIGGLTLFYLLNNPTPVNVTTGPSVEPIVPNSLVTALVFRGVCRLLPSLLPRCFT